MANRSIGWKRSLTQSIGEKAETLKTEMLTAGQNGAEGRSDIEGKAPREGASEWGSERVSIGPISTEPKEIFTTEC